MRIGIDATWAGVAGTGTASYTRGLVRALLDSGRHDLTLYFRPGDEQRNPLIGEAAGRARRRWVSGRGQPGRSLLGLARAATADQLDLFHSPGYFLPLWPGPKVVTFHDANAVLQLGSRARGGAAVGTLSLAAQSLLASRLATLVITDSHYAAASVARVFRLPSDRVRVVYPGIDASYFAVPDPVQINAVREHFRLDRYALVVGELAPHKNAVAAVEALQYLDDRDLSLVLAGRSTGRYEERVLRPAIRRLGLESRVTLVGTPTDDVLRSLYSGAEMLIFPSLGEGFGLPPLEAMASGIPVVASNRTSIAEVVANGALVVEPTPMEIAQAAQRLLDDPRLRATQVHNGRERARLFTWERAADATLRVYGEAV